MVSIPIMYNLLWMKLIWLVFHSRLLYMFAVELYNCGNLSQKLPDDQIIFWADFAIRSKNSPNVPQVRPIEEDCSLSVM